VEATITSRSAVSTADLSLSVIAGVLVVAALAGTLLSVPLSFALGAGSLPAGATVGYALFFDPPTG